jgi:hypothetical protein
VTSGKNDGGGCIGQQSPKRGTFLEQPQRWKLSRKVFTRFRSREGMKGSMHHVLGGSLLMFFQGMSERLP